jgi:flavin reductase (DIM6/NTAB) family NADH-FMN oxidoreductase RutF
VAEPSLQIDPTELSEHELAHLMTGLIVSRPIAWVSTLNEAGTANLAPHSYFNGVSSKPPILMFCSTHSSPHRPNGRKDSLVNIERTGEFVVNLVSEDLLAAMNETSALVAPGIDEFALAGLAKTPSTKVRPPTVAKARAALECRLDRIIEVGDASVVFGEVVWFRIDRRIWREDRVDAGLLQPMGRLGGSFYAALGPITRMVRPKG